MGLSLSGDVGYTAVAAISMGSVFAAGGCGLGGRGGGAGMGGRV